MKLKYLLIGGLGLMLAGGTLAVSSYKLGGHKNLIWENGPKLMDMAQDVQIIPPSEKIDKIVIHANHQQVQITRGLDFEIQTSYEKQDKPLVSIKEQTLTIEGNARDRDVLVSLEDNTPSITLTIPKDLSFSEIELEGDNSYFGLFDLSTEKLSMKTYGGTISLDNFKGKSAKIDDKQGNMMINHSAIQKLSMTGRNTRLYFRRVNKYTRYT
ncbi:MAG: DUF4097 family beta strand repeat protein [Enterococcus lacertideformus]|uniref:DUF4097 family beta strand repeat protein n=1 Tax=Enterococcus lacertideformus TaxID=2771493 RepID=A0A931AXU5_9ENTE|nr:DUF4097 family beta strand repeat protein [Enterococcus lacertideformus]